MSNMKNIDDVLEYLTKQREMNKQMSYLPHDKISAMARREQLATRYSRMLVDARENPHERIVPEGFCVTCQSFTTAYNSRGECEVCKTEVTADISEGETK